MATQTVFSATNIAIAAAPASYYLPNAAGVAVPAGATSWTARIDLGGTIPSGLAFVFGVEYQRNAWVDAAGITHPAGEWLPDCAFAWVTGSFLLHGTPTTIHIGGSTIGAVNAGGGMVEPYPIRARFRMDQTAAITLPSATLEVI